MGGTQSRTQYTRELTGLGANQSTQVTGYTNAALTLGQYSFSSSFGVKVHIRDCSAYGQAEAREVRLTQGSATLLQCKSPVISEVEVTPLYARYRRKYDDHKRLIDWTSRVIQLRHPNVVRIMAVRQYSPDDYSIDMLLDMHSEESTLHEFCKTSYLGTIKILNYTEQLLRGLQFLHSQQVPLILTDLTSQSVLVTQDHKTVKIWRYFAGIEVLEDRSLYRLEEEFSMVPSSNNSVKLRILSPALYYSAHLLFLSPVVYLHSLHENIPNNLTDIVFPVEDIQPIQNFTLHPCMDLWSLGCVILDMVSEGLYFRITDTIGPDRNKVYNYASDYFNMVARDDSSQLPVNLNVMSEELYTRIIEKVRNTVHLTGPFENLGKNLMMSTYLLEAFVRRVSPPIPKGVPDTIKRILEVCFDRDQSDPYDAARLLAYVQYLQEEQAHRSQWPCISVANGGVFRFEWADYIGFGSYGIAYTVNVRSNIPGPVDCRNYKNYATKTLKVLNSCLVPESRGNVLVSLRDNNVVRYIITGTVAVGPGNIPFDIPRAGVIMDYYGGGNLHTLAKSQDLTCDEILGYVCQVAAGVAYLHSRAPGIVHGDLKGQNIFLTSDKPIVLKIGDLEDCAELGTLGTARSGLKDITGTYSHMSPEMQIHIAGDRGYDGISYDETTTGIGRATDIWSVACIVLELFGKGEIRYTTSDDRTTTNAREVVKGANPDLSVADTKRIEPGLRDIVCKCLHRTPKERPMVPELVCQLSNLRL